MNTDHMKFVPDVAGDDIDNLNAKEREYKGSWKRRGGVGAFMMLARKWDRIEAALQPKKDAPSEAACSYPGWPVAPFDIFGALEADQRDEGLIDDVRDLRRYLCLVEAEWRARRVKEQQG